MESGLGCMESFWGREALNLSESLIYSAIDKKEALIVKLEPSRKGFLVKTDEFLRVGSNLGSGTKC